MNTARLQSAPAALLALAVWALAAGSGVWWWLHAGSGAAAPAAPVAGRGAQAAIDTAAVARALGAESNAAAAVSAPVAAVSADGLFALRGVLTHGAGGAALISIGGKAARPVRTGAALGKDAEGWMLHEVQPHAVVLAASDGRRQRLEMPGEEERARILKERATRGGQAAPAAPLPQASQIRRRDRG